MWFTIQFFFWHPAISNVIHGPGFSGTMFFRIQLFQGRSFFKVQIFQGQVFTFQGFSRFGSRIRVQVLEVAKQLNPGLGRALHLDLKNPEPTIWTQKNLDPETPSPEKHGINMGLKNISDFRQLCFINLLKVQVG